jgi:hypothetical protein
MKELNESINNHLFLRGPPSGKEGVVGRAEWVLLGVGLLILDSRTPAAHRMTRVHDA